MAQTRNPSSAPGATVEGSIGVAVDGAPKVGLVAVIAEVSARFHAKWLCVRLRNDAKQFTAFVELQAGAPDALDLERALRGLKWPGMHVTRNPMRKNDRLSDALAYTLRLTCHDTPGIFGASLGVLERHGARIEGIATERIDAAFSGEHMLRIRAGIRVHDEIIGRMCAALEELATEMIVEIDRDSVEAGHLTVAANRNNPGL